MPIPNFKGETALVTGGAGFIGSNLVDALLAREANVTVLDNFSNGSRENLEHCKDKIRIVEGDICEAAACAEATKGASYVFHQAALGSVPRSLDHPGNSVAANVGGTTNMMEAARDAKVRRFVYASSSSVYGDSTVLPKKEGTEGQVLSPYALSKAMNEQLADVFARCYGLECIGLRYFNIYGPRQSPKGAYAAVIPLFFDACKRGVSPKIHGDGEQSRDFTFVEDAVLANLLAAGAPKEACNRAFNIGAGGRTMVNDLAAKIAEAVGVDVKPEHGPPRAGDVAHSHADIADATRLLGYKPEISLDEGLRRTHVFFSGRMRFSASEI